MTAQQNRIVAYIGAHWRLQPYADAAAGGMYAWPQRGIPLLPPAEKLAAEFFADAEFQALALGTWLGTIDGRLISEAVAQIIPPGYEPAFTVTVEALRLAAAQQSAERQRKAGAVALAVVVGSTVLALSKGRA